jgi:alkanesulfonate monooxygenase SsuD/methylene tetrahydromethanopterin reductase-like flavin-dependent oxidoreductase (luciferase family)
VSKQDRAYAHPIGVSLGDMTPPELLGEKARQLEDLGYSHLMIPEDYFYEPALIGCTLALGATRSVPIGTSIVSGLVRSPAVLAMELAGISRAFPGRFRPGIGLGLPAWLAQMGILPAKPVTALRESITSVQRLLAGETVSLDGVVFQLDDITITHPALEHVPITLGVMGPMLLELSGQIADGTLFGALAGVDFFRWAMAQVEKGLTTSGRTHADMAYSTVALTLVDRDGAKARALARPILASFLGEFGVNTLTDAYGISDQVTEILERGGPEAMEAEMPDQWLEDLTLVGTPEEVVAKIRAWVAAGVDSICIFLPDQELEPATIELVAQEVIPAFR